MLPENRIKIGAKVMCHSRQFALEMAEVAVPRAAQESTKRRRYPRKN
jgi:hypothetical protein